jgi:N-acetylglucosaminyl-diphospho-decaprenol L-rhamnosyltransferase
VTDSLARAVSHGGRARAPVAAVVVHYRTPERLRECLASLERQLAIGEILVVDNSGSVRRAPDPEPGAGWSVHRTRRNLGYGGACNLGATLTESEQLLFLNADLVLCDAACERLCATLSGDPKAAVAGPRIYGADGEIELSARAFPSLRTGLVGRSSALTALLRRTGGPPATLAAALSDQPVRVDWVSGACMLVRRRAFEQIGGFDEGFWMYWEDADLCRRLFDGGWRTIFCPQAEARHSTGSSGASRRTIEAFHESAARYYARHSARSPAAAGLARGLLRIRTKAVLRRHAHRVGPDPHSQAGKRVLIEALAARFGGTAQLTVHLSRELSRRPEIARVTVLTRQGSIVERELDADRDVRCVSLGAPRRLELARRVVWLATRLRGLLARERCDALISMSGVLPARAPVTTVCVLGNAAMYADRTAANRLRRWAVRRTARHAAHLLAPSRAMAELVTRSTGRPCAAVALGVDRELFFPAPSPGGEILCVADFYAHKRHDLLLDAWLALPAPRPRLRLVGDPEVDREAHRRLLRRIHASGADETIALAYRVPHEDMGEIYRRARVFVLPSEIESFCMPLAEAMACGVPSVVRDLASIRETGGAGGVYVDGEDAGVWAAVMRRLMEDASAHLAAREAAIDSAARFSWQVFAAEIAIRL